jgi:hypothetical protein
VVHQALNTVTDRMTGKVLMSDSNLTTADAVARFHDNYQMCMHKKSIPQWEKGDGVI